MHGPAPCHLPSSLPASIHTVRCVDCELRSWRKVEGLVRLQIGTTSLPPSVPGPSSLLSLFRRRLSRNGILGPGSQLGLQPAAFAQSSPCSDPAHSSCFCSSSKFISTLGSSGFVCLLAKTYKAFMSCCIHPNHECSLVSFHLPLGGTPSRLQRRSRYIVQPGQHC